MVTSDYNDYSSVCIEAATNDSFFSTFKRNNTYRAILEHTSYEQGMGYLGLLEKHELFNDIPWDAILTNDKLGDPITSKYIINERQVDMSPSTLRYVFYAIETLTYVKQNGITEPNIIEIGGGYGGQCYVSSLLSSLLGVKIKNYAILDLPGPVMLTNKYLQTQIPGTQFRAYNLHEIELPKKPNNFLISNYAFAEFDDQTRKVYIDYVIKNTALGYIAWNSETPFDEFFNTCEISVKEEKPNTGYYNKILTFINKN
jgi:putative sugar O-methyltransferase